MDRIFFFQKGRGSMGETIKEQHIWIGVDVGTTGVRAIAYEASGVSRASAEAFYPLRTPHPDWAEERPAEIRRLSVRQRMPCVIRAAEYPGSH